MAFQILLNVFIGFIWMFISSSVHRLDSSAAQLELQAQIEIRRIDANEHVRLCGDQITSELTATAKQFEQAAEHLDQAHDSQPLHREIGFQALGFHPRTTDTNEFGIRIALLDGLHQTGAKNVTGRFTGDQCDAKGSVHRDLEPVQNLAS